jgi:hypothetical protein
VEVRGNHVRELASELAGLGQWLEVMAPADVRAELHRIGRELAQLYGS